MLRSILVALDATPSSTAAQGLAIEIARRCQCTITGLTVLDRAHITAPTPVGIGGMAFKQHRDQVKLEEAKAFLSRLEQGFEKSCEAIGALCQVIEAEGIPHKLIEQESARHDLLVIGKDTDFHFDEDPSIADAVQRLLHENSRPIIACPETAPADGPVLIAHDGSVRASRAIHMLALLGFAQSRPIHVVSIAGDRSGAEERARRAADLLIKHGYDVTVHGVASDAEPADIILAQREALGATMIVMGAYGQSALHDFFLGSTTKKLLNACPCPLFVHH
ncbi:MAG: universal stress protein [Geminicoccales bacterium]